MYAREIRLLLLVTAMQYIAYQGQDVSALQIDYSATQVHEDIMANKKYDYVVLKIEHGWKLVVDVVGKERTLDCSTANDDTENKLNFQEMESHLANKPRFILFNFCFPGPLGIIKENVALIAWIPNDSDPLKKRNYAHSLAALKDRRWAPEYFLIEDKRDLQYKLFISQLLKGARR